MTAPSDTGVTTTPPVVARDAGPAVAPLMDAGGDAGGAPPLDAGVDTMDASSDAQSSNPPACAADATPYSCACAANPANCEHPLRGRYAVRTVSYARQKTTAAGQALDVVSKGVLFSVADISASGDVKEHICFLELINDDLMFSWVLPSSAQRIPDSMTKLEERAGGFVRSLAQDMTNVSWSAAKQPADCAAGMTHSTGCLCFAADSLPSDPKDCRVTDLDEDGVPGLKLAVSFERPVDPSSAEALISVQIAGRKGVEWRLPGKTSDRLVGMVEGSVEQNQLSVGGELAAELGKVKNANCSSDSAHVELVRGDFDCAKLLAGRSKNPDDYGVFDAKLDGQKPPIESCPDPDCAGDTDGDGTTDCKDACPADKTKTTAGVCGCGLVETNTDGDTLPDCTDACPSDPAKTAAGVCGCGVAETNTDGDALPDCTDACASDPAKTVAGACGCGVAETNTDGDALPDCTDACASDPAKTAAGACGCGVAETNTDGDALPDCTDACASDPAKTAPGICGCGVADSDTDSDGTVDCNEACDNDPAKTAAGQCGCGVADADLNGDGTIDCADLCLDDPAKIAPGACGCGVADTNTDGDSLPDCTDVCDTDAAKVAAGACGCGVADTNTDGDAQPDCLDECDTDPAKVAAGTCGCGVAESVCNSPLLGTYALRSVLHARQRIGSGAATTSRAIGYSLVTITNAASGALTVSEKSCWAQTLPNPSESGTKVYSWSKPEWAQAMPLTVRTATVQASGNWLATTPSAPFGFDPARQPASCTSNATPPSGWPSTWGSTCACHAPATSLPPYDSDTTPYDCRLTDPDGDGYPGASVYVSTSGPSDPDAAPSGLSGRAFAANLGSSSWTLIPGANGKHTGTMNDSSTSAVVGCTGIACAGLGSVSPSAAVCPENLNTLQFVPTSASSDTCAEILDKRGELFTTAQDASWAAAAACPAP